VNAGNTPESKNNPAAVIHILCAADGEELNPQFSAHPDMPGYRDHLLQPEPETDGRILSGLPVKPNPTEKLLLRRINCL
jgi:hypothetical protein